MLTALMIFYAILFLLPISIGAAVWCVEKWNKRSDPVARAQRDRDARRAGYVVEFLNYGYDRDTAETKADARMRQSAKAAEDL